MEVNNCVVCGNKMFLYSVILKVPKCSMCKDPEIKDHFCTGRSNWRYLNSDNDRVDTFENGESECIICHSHACHDNELSSTGVLLKCKYKSLKKDFKYVFYEGFLRKYTGRNGDIFLPCFTEEHYEHSRKLFNSLKVSYLCKLFIVKRMFTDFEKVLILKD